MSDDSDKLVMFLSVENAVVCGEGSHLYDGRLHAQCPACTSAERVHLTSWIGHHEEPQGSANAIPTFEEIAGQCGPCRISFAEEEAS